MIGSFVDEIPHHPTMRPRVLGVPVGVGIGKSDAALRALSDWLVKARGCGDQRNVMYLAPTLRLCDELAGRLRVMSEAAGLTIRVWRGREAPDPDDPDKRGELMCRRLDAVQAVQKAGGSVSTQVCGEGQDKQCPFFKTCSYQRQKRQRVDFWFAAHAFAFSDMPWQMGAMGAVVVDKSFWQAGLEGIERKIALNIEDLRRTVRHEKPEHTEEHLAIRRRLYAALATLEDGNLSRAGLIEAGITEAIARRGRKLEEKLLVRPDVSPDMTRADIKAACERVQERNDIIVRMRRLFVALEDLLAPDGPEHSGWIVLATDETSDPPRRELRLRGRRDIAAGLRVDTLVLDAILNAELLKFYWPQIEVAPQIQAEAPHATFRQVVAHDYAMQVMAPRGGIIQPNRNRDGTREVVFGMAWRTPGKVLAVTFKDTEEDWRKAPIRPPNLALAHFNGMAGRDCWGDTARQVVIGRLEPRAADLERMAEALTGTAVTARVEQYSRHTEAVACTDGSTARLLVAEHPDPIVEAIRWQVCEGELVQAIGRARAVNRTAENPVEILILTTRRLPIRLDAIISAAETRPSMVDRMLCAGGLAFLSSPGDAATAYPDLWQTAAAAEKAAQRDRARWRTFPIKRSPNSKCPPPLRSATYQCAGSGMRPGRVEFAPAVVPPDELRPWLEFAARLHAGAPGAGSAAGSTGRRGRSGRPGAGTRDRDATAADSLAGQPPRPRHRDPARPERLGGHLDRGRGRAGQAARHRGDRLRPGLQSHPARPAGDLAQGRSGRRLPVAQPRGGADHAMKAGGFGAAGPVALGCPGGTLDGVH